MGLQETNPDSPLRALIHYSLILCGDFFWVEGGLHKTQLSQITRIRIDCIRIFFSLFCEFYSPLSKFQGISGGFYAKPFIVTNADEFIGCS